MNPFARGEGTTQRFVCDILPESAPAAQLLVVEVRTPSSHSSSYPAHKHDRQDLPNESALEETYYHRIDRAQVRVVLLNVMAGDVREWHFRTDPAHEWMLQPVTQSKYSE